MSAFEFMQQRYVSDQREAEASPPELPGGSSVAARAVNLGTTIAAAVASSPIVTLCTQCRMQLDPESSSARFPTVFCSDLCEQEFIRAALASLTIEDCVRIQSRLDALGVSDSVYERESAVV